MDSSGGRLDALQKRVLESLADLEPPFVLSGGGALVGVYLGHRTTRDLDLFWRNRAHIGDLARAVEERLKGNDLDVSTLQRSPAFGRLRVSDRNATAIVDLIAEPGDNLEPPAVHRIGRTNILVDTAQAILVEKLCALLERAELRDLVDIEALARHGENLDEAIERAPQRDSGFSPLTLAWLLREMDVKAIAEPFEFGADHVDRLNAFRRKLIDRLLTPPSSRGA